MSASLYDTFGNEISYDLRRGILTAYIEDATIDFPLPQASAELLERFSDPINTMNQQHLDMIKSKLEKIGFKKANAKALAPVLITVAKELNTDVLEFFEDSNSALELTTDAYKAINVQRPAGSRINVSAPTVNSKSKVASLIKP
jgi:hypothetical protein|tara:strand:+ start:209 stop:640 length:432 start_codon:yes stop_codon:yes gene_type:complete